MRQRSTRSAIQCAVTALSALLWFVACGKRESPEAQVRATIAHAETAAEGRDVATLRALISDNYADSQGQDKRAIEAVLRVTFLRNESVHLFTRIREVSFPEKDRALVVVQVAMAGQAVKSAQELEGLRASLYRFEIVFHREGDHWRVLRAEWRPAEPGELL